jgi:hypothetical protein
MNNDGAQSQYLPSEVSQILFKAFANPKCVNFDVIREVPADARFPPARSCTDSTVTPASPSRGAPETTALVSSPADEAAALAMLAQARALDEASRTLLESALRLCPAAVEAARVRLGWPGVPVERYLADGTLAPSEGSHHQESVSPMPPAWHDAEPTLDDVPKTTLRKLDVSRLGVGRIHVIVGKRGTGKTQLLRDIVSRMRGCWDWVAGMSPTPESIEMMEEIMPASCVHDEYDPDAVARIIETLRRLEYNGIKTRTALILDDCIFDSSVLKSLVMRDLFMNSRHLGMDVFVVCQYTMDIPKALRAQIDYAYVLREPQKEYRLNLYKNFFGVFDTYEQFCPVLDACTENHGCLVINNLAKSNNIEDTVFWYRADPNVTTDDLISGSYDQWLLHYMFYESPDVRFALGEGIPILARLAGRRGV